MRKSHIPVFFFARANHKREGKAMAAAEAEWVKIAHLLETPQATGACEVLPPAGQAPPYLIETLLTPAVRERIALLHITGPADGDQLRFDSDSGLEAIDLRTIANALGALPHLRLVLLNGCGARLVVEELLEAGAGAVMVAPLPGTRARSDQFIEAFYESIADGNTIRESFIAAIEVDDEPYVFVELPYDSFTRSPDWSKVPETEGGMLRPGLYAREDMGADQLDWRIRRKKVREKQTLYKSRVWLSLVAGVLLILGGGFSAVSYYQHKYGPNAARSAARQISEVSQVSGISGEAVSDSAAASAIPRKDTIERPARMLRDSSVFANPEMFKVLILPIQAYKKCEGKTTDYENALKKRLTELQQFHGLKAEIQLFAEETPVQGVYAPEEIGQLRHADLVVWGHFTQQCNEATALSLRYQPTGLRGETIFETPGLVPETSFTDFGRNTQDEVLQPILNVILWEQANQKLAEKRYSLALHLFQLIRTEEKAAYAPVYMRQGLCYFNLRNRIRAEQLLDRALELDGKYGPAHCYKGHINRQRGLIDKAWVDYSNAIQYLPRYAEAYYSRGLVHEQVYKFTEAIRDYEEAIRIQPDFPEARERSRIVRQTYKELLDLNRQILSNPGNADLYFEKAKLLQYQLANHDSALVYYNRGIALKDDNPHGYFERGHLYQYQFLEYDKAIADYEKGLSLKPGYRFALGNLAVIHATRQNDERFYYYLEEALKNAYDVTFFIEKAISEPYRDAPRFLSLLEKYP